MPSKRQMSCAQDSGEIHESYAVCPDHFHYGTRKIPRPVVDKSLTLGHARVKYLEQIAEIVERSPHLILTFISNRIGAKICPRHPMCFYLPKADPFPTNRAVEEALAHFLDTFVFCQNCASSANMDLTLNSKSGNLLAHCRNGICNASYIGPPFIGDFNPTDLARVKNDLSGGEQEGERSTFATKEAGQSGGGEKSTGDKAGPSNEHL